jgi:hypothetical protein
VFIPSLLFLFSASRSFQNTDQTLVILAMTTEPDSSLLTPPPDPEHIRSVLSKNMDAYPNPRILDDSSEDDALYQDHLNEATTTTTTTTTTTVLPKAAVKKGLSDLVAHHQTLHQKIQSSPSGGNGSDVEETLHQSNTQKAFIALPTVELRSLRHSQPYQRSPRVKAQASPTTSESVFRMRIDPGWAHHRC